MACVTAAAFRDCARAAMLSAGGRGFVRFLPEGGALLVTDAGRRCADEAALAALTGALETAGFACRERDGLLELTPRDEMLGALACQAAGNVDWDSPLHPALALSRRWRAAEKLPLTADGRQIIIETLRLTWQPQDKALAGLHALRARAAVMLRRGDRSGLHEAGAVLENWCASAQGGMTDEA